MTATPLHFHWTYTDVDRAFWAEHLEPWLPRRIMDAHTHVSDPCLRLKPMSETMRRQYWVNEVFEPIDAPTAEHCYRTVFPGREFSCIALGVPDLAFDIDGCNRYLQEQCPEPRLAQPGRAFGRSGRRTDVAALLDAPSVIGVKPYYALISPSDADARPPSGGQHLRLPAASVSWRC